jgi:hypothetical protein
VNRFHTNEKNQSLNFKIFILWNKYIFRLELITSHSPPKGGVRVGKRETPKLWALERYLKGHGLEIRAIVIIKQKELISSTLNHQLKL